MNGSGDISAGNGINGCSCCNGVVAAGDEKRV
jgi:hypothetical protein